MALWQVAAAVTITSALTFLLVTLYGATALPVVVVDDDPDCSITDNQLLAMVFERALQFKVGRLLSQDNLYELVTNGNHMKHFIWLYLRDNNFEVILSFAGIMAIIGSLVTAYWFFLFSLSLLRFAGSSIVIFARFMRYAARDFDPESIPLQPARHFIQDDHLVDNSDHSNEAVVQGSTLLPAAVPKFQCYIVSVDQAGKATYIGSGFRVRNAVYTVRHNLSAIPSECELYIYSRNGVDKACVPVDQWLKASKYDLASVVLDPKVLSRLQLCSAKLPKEPLHNTQYVQISSDKNATTGLLRGSETTCGEVDYHGSTLPGFSGAPYYSGPTVFGIHVGVNGSNFGYDVLFADHLFYTEEDSAELDYTHMLDDWKNKRTSRFLHVDDGAFVYKGKNRYRRIEDNMYDYVRDLEMDQIEQTGRGFDTRDIPSYRREREPVRESAAQPVNVDTTTASVVDALIADPEPMIAPPVFRDVPAPQANSTRPTGADVRVLNQDSSRQTSTHSLGLALAQALVTNGLVSTVVPRGSASPTTSTGSRPRRGRNQTRLI